MRKVIFSLLVTLILMSCNQTTERRTHNIKVYGTIKNNKDSFILLKRNHNGFKSYKSQIDEHGNYEFQIDTDESMYYTFQLDNKSIKLFLKPNDILNIDCDSKSFLKSISLKNNGNIENQYLIEKEIKKTSSQLDIDNIFSQQTDRFIQIADSVLVVNLRELEDHKNFNLLNAEFKELERATIIYNWANWMYVYPDYYTYLTKKEFNDIDGTYYNYVKKLDLNNEQHLKSEGFVSFLHQYVNTKIDEELKKDVDSNNSSKLKPWLWYKVVDKTFDNQNVKDKLYFDGLSQQLEEYPTDIAALYNCFEELCLSETMKNKGAKLFNDYKKINAGSMAIPIEMMSSDGTKYTLEQFKGKYVYIDLWASWCGPCLAEYKILKKLKEEFKDKNIVFIGLSVDDNYKNWERMIKVRNMDGYQFIAEGGWNSSVIKDYKVTSIPRFIFIDTEGKIISFKALKPSEDIREEFLKLNI